MRDTRGYKRATTDRLGPRSHRKPQRQRRSPQDTRKVSGRAQGTMQKPDVGLPVPSLATDGLVRGAYRPHTRPRDGQAQWGYPRGYSQWQPKSLPRCGHPVQRLLGYPRVTASTGKARGTGPTEQPANSPSARAGRGVRAWRREAVRNTGIGLGRTTDR